MAELVIATNPDPDSRLPYIISVPYGDGLIFRAGDTWPRTKAVYCYPIDEWPEGAEVVERVDVRSCARRGASIDLVLNRGRENRSQIVYTRARGRDAVFWQSARTRKSARPGVRTPTARAAGIAEIPILIDSHERYAYKFSEKQAVTQRRKLAAGDYGVEYEGRLVAAVERKSLVDLVAGLTGGKLRYQLADLAALAHAAVVIEDRYSQVYKLERVRPSVVANGLAEVQVRYPTVPIVFCETRRLAEEWTYRFLGAALSAELDAGDTDSRIPRGGARVSNAEIRAWARRRGLAVSERGRIASSVVDAFWAANPGPRSSGA